MNEMRCFEPRHRVRLALLALLVATGCSLSSHKSESVAGEVDSTCSAFLVAYERCQNKLGAPKAAAERVSTTREALSAQTNAATTEAERARVSARCESGLEQLHTLCP